MKILFFFHYPNPIAEGGWTRIKFFADYFKQQGTNVSIAGAFSLKTIHKIGRSNLNGIKLYNFTPIIMFQNLFSLIFNILSSILSSFFLLITIRPDVIIISVPRGDTGYGAFIVSKLFCSKIIFDYRDEWEDYSIENAPTGLFKNCLISLKNKITSCYINSSLIITVTEPLVKKLQQRGINKIELVPNGADTTIFKRSEKSFLRKKFGYNDNDFIFVYSGLIGSYYKLDIIVKALKSLLENSSNIKLILMGKNSIHLQQILQLGEKLGIKKSIFYLGEKTDPSELANILCISDVGIIPYDSNPLWKNSLPSKAFEYLACGLPVVATVQKDSVLAKLIRENKVGLVVEPNNLDELVLALEEIYKNSDLRNKAIQKTFTLIEQKFDRKKIAEEFFQLLRNLNHANT